MENSIKEKKRIYLLDELRGFAVFCMVFYHAFYTMALLFDMRAGEKLIEFFMPAEPLFAWLFVVISGISSQLSKSNLQRGVKLAGIAAAITVLTTLADEFFDLGITINFGILHMLSVSILLFHFLRRALEKISPLGGFLFFSLLFWLTFNVQAGFVGIRGVFEIPLPKEWYNLPYLFPFGIFTRSFVSADYFPLFPWFFAFLSGTFLGVWAKAEQFPAWTYKPRNAFFRRLGKHSLLIYVLHQPVIYALLSGILMIVKN